MNQELPELTPLLATFDRERQGAVDLTKDWSLSSGMQGYNLQQPVTQRPRPVRPGQPKRRK